MHLGVRFYIPSEGITISVRTLQRSEKDLSNYLRIFLISINRLCDL